MAQIRGTIPYNAYVRTPGEYNVPTYPGFYGSNISWPQRLCFALGARRPLRAEMSWGLGFRVWGLGFRVWGFGFRV